MQAWWESISKARSCIHRLCSLLRRPPPRLSQPLPTPIVWPAPSSPPPLSPSPSPAPAVRCLYARASHDMAPRAILAARSLIQLDKRARQEEEARAAATTAIAAFNSNTPSKAKKPEILLVSK